MKHQLAIGVALAASSLVLAVSESTALAALPCELTPPAECAALRDTMGYTAGVYQGMSLVGQIWGSTAVGQNIDNWGLLKTQVDTAIPTIVASAYTSAWSQYTQCRVQGLLDGTVCKMNQIDPIPGCQMDGGDWGSISAALYCNLSIAFGGLGDVAPWFIRPTPGMCGDKFQNYCEDVYRYSATRGADDLLPEVEAFLIEQGLNPENFWQPEACLQYTDPTPDADPTNDPAFTQVYEDSIYIDCSYTLPPMP